MNKRVAVIVAGIGVMGALALGGCTVKAGNFVEPDALGEQVAVALAESVGSEAIPNIDCGEDKIYFKKDLEVKCVLSVDGDDAEYDVTVTFDEVDGKEYHFNSVVADEPRA